MADSNTTNDVVYDSRRPGNPNENLGAPLRESSNSASNGTQSQQSQSRNGTQQSRNGVQGGQRSKAVKNGTSKRTDSEREPLVAKQSKGRAQKEAALRHKLRTYEMFLALQEGYMPSTDQAAAWGEYLLKTSSVLDSRNRKYSASGRTFIKDVRAWIEAIIDLGAEKNDDDKFQDFIWHTTHSRIQTKVPDVGSASKKIRSGADADAKKAVERLRGLGSLLYGSPEFRKLLNDIAVLGREIFADAAETAASNLNTAAEKSRPSKSDVENVDKTAEEASGGTEENVKKEDLPSQEEAKDEADKTQQKAKNYAEQAKKKGYESKNEVEKYLKSKFPKQRQDALVSRLKKLLNDIQSDPEYSDTVEFLMNLTQKYFERIRDAALEKGEKAKEAAKDADVDTNKDFDLALEEGNDILVTLANGKTLDGVKEALQKVNKDVQEDEDLSQFYSDVVDFLNRSLKDKDYITSDAADDEAHRLYERARELFNTKQDDYKPDVEHLFDELKEFGEAIQKDKAIQRVINTGNKVWSDVVSVKYGRVTLKPRVLKDILDIMVPKFISEIKYIPVPRIEYQDKDIDLILENLVLESDNFLPRRSVFEATQKAEFTNGWSFTSAYTATTKINIRHFALFIKDASFIIRKKTGLVQFSDRGFFDILMDGAGASAEIELSTQAHSADHEDANEDDVDSFFNVEKVKVTIHNFSYNYHAYHSWAAAILRPIIRPVIRQVLSKLLEKQIRESLENLDRELWAMSERARVATIANDGKGSIESWIRAVVTRPSIKRRRKPRRGDFEVTVGETELFPDEHGPGAIIPQITAAEERVAEGGDEDTWRSDVFNVRV